MYFAENYEQIMWDQLGSVFCTRSDFGRSKANLISSTVCGTLIYIKIRLWPSTITIFQAIRNRILKCMQCNHCIVYLAMDLLSESIHHHSCIPSAHPTCAISPRLQYCAAPLPLPPHLLILAYVFPHFVSFTVVLLAVTFHSGDPATFLS